MKTTFLLLCLFLLTACGNNRSGLEFSESISQELNVNDAVTFAQLRTSIIDPHCLKCHKSLTSEEALAKWVVAGDVEGSKLYQVIKDGSMPKKAAPLSSAELELVRHYIEGLTMPPQEIVNFEIIQKEILNPSCVSCHKSMTSEANLMKWINPEDPLNSRFYLSVKEGRMPKKADPLALDKQELILQYLKNFLK
ncbi:MAG: hypothetical protein NDI69_00035 [Bacteriovoracaceae bacterium]|nr:hypothetical protein [Bacteriovoracaceae bacterium]